MGDGCGGCRIARYDQCIDLMLFEKIFCNLKAIPEYLFGRFFTIRCMQRIGNIVKLYSLDRIYQSRKNCQTTQAGIENSDSEDGGWRMEDGG
jgi:hypothetical protein